MPATDPNAPLSDEDIAELADLLDDAATRTDAPLSLEGFDGFMTALHCGPRAIDEADYLAELFGHVDPASLFGGADAYRRFRTLYTRRWKHIARALATSIDSLTDTGALRPLIVDWEGMLATVPKSEAAALRAAGVPPYAGIWAAGFLQVVEHWEADWELPADSKDEAFVDEMLDPLYVLMTPPEEWTAAEREHAREDYVAMAIWSCYELRDFWRDRGQAPRA